MWFWGILITLVFLLVINGFVLLFLYKKSNTSKTVEFIYASLTFLIIAAVFLYGLSAGIH